jgi:hypothetical protein
VSSVQQLGLFDAPAGERLREEGIENAGGGAPAVAMAEAVEAVRGLAVARPRFTTDDVWQALQALGGVTFPEPRAMGAVMRRAEREEYIRATEAHVLSKRKECHRRPLRVWESVIFGPGRAEPSGTQTEAAASVRAHYLQEGTEK